MKHLTLIFLCLFIISSACKKKKEPVPTNSTQNNTATIISGTWKVTYIAEDENDNFIVDEVEKYPPDTSLFLLFNTDGTGFFSGDVNSLQQGGPVRWSVSDKMLSMLFREDDGTWDPDDTEYYYISSLTTTDMLWQDEPDSATFFIGLARQ